LANILDFGTTATIYSYLPALYEKKSHDLYSFIKSIFLYQSFFSFLVIAGLFISFPYLDKVFFKTEAPLWELWLTSFSVLFFIWQNFLQICASVFTIYDLTSIQVTIHATKSTHEATSHNYRH